MQSQFLRTGGRPSAAWNLATQIASGFTCWLAVFKQAWPTTPGKVCGYPPHWIQQTAPEQTANPGLGILPSSEAFTVDAYHVLAAPQSSLLLPM